MKGLSCLNVYLNYLIVGSKDGFIFIFDTKNNFNKVQESKGLGSSILSIFFTKNAYDKEVFCVNTENGEINIMDPLFNEICKIPSYSKSSVSYFYFKKLFRKDICLVLSIQTDHQKKEIFSLFQIIMKLM